MASIINAATSGGLVTSADTSGVLQLQTASTTAVTVDASQNVSLAVGTANGVTYLNGSKVLTSGSALTYNGTDLQFASGSGLFTNTSDGSDTATLAIGGGGANSTARGSVIELYGNENATAGVLDMTSGNVANSYVRIQGRSSTSYVRFDINASEQMRLTSTGLGIGTSSPASKFQVTSANGAVTLDSGTGESHYIDITHKGSYSDLGGIRFNQGSTTYGNNQILFRAMDSGGTVQTVMTLNGAGNLGLGVTPSAWGSGSTAFQLGNGGIWKSGSRSVDWIVNGYYNGTNYIYNQTAAATYYRQYDGQHLWFNAPSGTAGNAISFTQALTLDANGNLFLGATTSPTTTGIALYKSTNTSYIDIAHSTTGAAYSYIRFTFNNGTEIGNIAQNSGGTAVSFNTSSDYRLKNIIGEITPEESGSYIDSLKPKKGTWKSDGSVFIGLLAHEAQESSQTEIATGVKDGEKMQSMTYSSSEMIANMIAELKSLRQRVAQLETN